MSPRRLRVWVLVLFRGSHGDDVQIHLSEEAVESAALDYMRDTWPGDGYIQGCPEDCPEDYEEAESWYLHGAFDNRFDLTEHEIEVPESPTPSRTTYRRMRNLLRELLEETAEATSGLTQCVRMVVPDELYNRVCEVLAEADRELGKEY